MKCLIYFRGCLAKKIQINKKKSIIYLVGLFFLHTFTKNKNIMKNYYIADGIKQEFIGSYLDLSNSSIKDLFIESDILEILQCENGIIENLKLNCSNLETIDCQNNKLINIELNCYNLKTLVCDSNNLTRLELTLPSLLLLQCTRNKLKNLKLNCQKLQSLHCSKNNLERLELDAPNLDWLNCSNNKLKNLKLNCSNLESLYCYNNKLKNLEFNTPNLKRMDCTDNQLKNLKLNAQNLISLHCHNKITLNGVPNVIGIDGYIEEILSEKKVGDFTTFKLKKGYAVKKDKFVAHGKTLKEAIEDCNFKLLQETIDLVDLVSEIKEKGTLNMSEYRLLTGACSSKSREFCDENNIKYDQEVDLNVAKELTKDRFGHSRFINLF